MKTEGFRFYPLEKKVSCKKNLDCETMSYGDEGPWQRPPWVNENP